MTEIEKMMKQMAKDAMKNSQGVKIDFNKMPTPNSEEEKEKVEEAVEAVVDFLGGLFSEVLGDLDNEFAKGNSTPKEKGEGLKSQSKAEFNKKPSLYKELLTKNTLGTKLKLIDLDKATLETLIVKEGVSVKDVAVLFDTTVEVVEYGMSLTGVKVPKKEDLLDKTLLHTCGLGDKFLNDYFKDRLNTMLKVGDNPLKSLIIKDFVLSINDIGNELGITSSPNELMLVKLGKDGKVVVCIYNLPVEVFLNKYDLSKIKWTV